MDLLSRKPSKKRKHIPEKGIQTIGKIQHHPIGIYRPYANVWICLDRL